MPSTVSVKGQFPRSVVSLQIGFLLQQFDISHTDLACRSESLLSQMAERVSEAAEYVLGPGKA